MIARLMGLFEGPDSMAPWVPPACPEPLHELLAWRAGTRGRNCTSMRRATGSCWKSRLCGDRRGTLGALAGVLADAAPPALDDPGHPLGEPAVRRPALGLGRCAPPGGRLHETIAQRRERLFGHAGWRALHPGGPPFTCADYRVFVTVCLAGLPGPASETALGSFRRALEGTLASSGAHARRLAPDELLSLATELIAPKVGQAGDATVQPVPGTDLPAAGVPGTALSGTSLLRPARRWSPRDPIHMQCASPAGR